MKFHFDNRRPCISFEDSEKLHRAKRIQRWLEVVTFALIIISGLFYGIERVIFLLLAIAGSIRLLKLNRVTVRDTIGVSDRVDGVHREAGRDNAEYLTLLDENGAMQTDEVSADLGITYVHAQHDLENLHADGAVAKDQRGDETYWTVSGTDPDVGKNME